jgi:O-antigen/teichoic acid export membrane protein
MSPIIKRVIAGVGANTYEQLANIFIQLVSLPIFLSHWDVKTYGTWLVITAIPSYLSMADVGMVTVAGNRMTMLAGAGDMAGANRVFQSAQMFILLACLTIAALVIPAALCLPVAMLASLDMRLALAALLAGVLLSLGAGLSGAAFRSTNRYALGISVTVTARLLEWLGGIAGLLLGGTFAAVAGGMLLVRVITLLWQSRLCTRNGCGLTWGLHHAHWAEVRAMLKPSLAFMTFPIANAITFQGFTLLTAHLLGPAAVAVFNTYRTVARVAVQVTSTLSHALWPEFARMFGSGEHRDLRHLLLRSSLLGALGAIALSLMLYFCAPLLLHIWTKGQIAFYPGPMSAFLLYAAIAGIWHIPRVILMATNQHGRLGIAALVISVLALLCAQVLGSSQQIMGLVMAMIVGELLSMAVCFWLAATTFLSRDNKDQEALDESRAVHYR